jgi:ribosomal subunit interface protein
MDITLIGRGVGITDQFRSYAEEKSDRVAALADRALALEIRLLRHHETNGTAGDDRVEMTLIGPGPVIRAEAAGPDKFVAFDTALNKLMERVRRTKDRKKLHRRGGGMTGLAEAAAGDFAGLDVTPADGDRMIWAETGGQQPATLPADDEPGDEYGEQDDYSPVVIRRKSFPAEPMSVDDALYRMELVGHDFYLFLDRETGCPSVVYRRVGWNYGVIALDGSESAGEQDGAGSAAAQQATEALQTTNA